MEIKVLGADSFDCRKLEEMVKVALKELGIMGTVIPVTDIAEIAKHGVLTTPGLVVNGMVKHTGKPVPDMNTIKDLLRSGRWMADHGGEVPALKVMFLCTGNSCRSQMAEGFARELGKGGIEAHSAGLLAAGVHRRAIAVMREIGIDISNQLSQVIDPDLLSTMDVVITLCDHAAESCPWTPPAVRRYHWPVRDPVGTTGSEETIMKEFRRARDEIRTKIQSFIAEMDSRKPC